MVPCVGRGLVGKAGEVKAFSAPLAVCGKLLWSWCDGVASGFSVWGLSDVVSLLLGSAALLHLRLALADFLWISSVEEDFAEILPAPPATVWAVQS